MVRRLWGDSSEARHTRVSPDRTYSWALSPVWSLRAASTGAAASTSGPAGGPAGGPAQTHQAGPEHKTTRVVSTDEPVALEGRGQPMGSGAGQRRRPGQLAQGQRAGLERAEYPHGLVQHSDTAYTLSHQSELYLRM